MKKQWAAFFLSALIFGTVTVYADGTATGLPGLPGRAGGASGGGGVTNVTATAPVVSSGGTTPNISVPNAERGVTGGLVSDTSQNFGGLKTMFDGLQVGQTAFGAFSAQYTSSFGPPGDTVITSVFNPGISSSGGTGLSVTGLDGTSPVQSQPGMVATCEGTLAGSTAILASGGGNFGIGITAVASNEGPAGDFTGGGIGDPVLDAPAIHAHGSNFGVPVRCDPSAFTAAIRLTPRTGAPTTPQEGDVWLDSADNTFHIYLGGTDRTVTTTP